MPLEGEGELDLRSYHSLAVEGGTRCAGLPNSQLLEEGRVLLLRSGTMISDATRVRDVIVSPRRNFGSGGSYSLAFDSAGPIVHHKAICFD